MNLKFLKNFYLLVFLTPLLFLPWGLEPFSVIKISWFTFIISFSLLTLGILFLNKTKFSIHYNKWLVSLFSLWVLSFTLSTVFSESPIQSLWGSYNHMLGSFSMLLLGIHFLISFLLFSKKDWKKILHIPIIIGLIISIIGILQWFNILSFGNNENFMGRIFATLGHPNFLGQYLLFTVIASFIFIKNSHSYKKILYISTSIIGFYALFLTQNRASIAAILIVGVLALIKKWKISKKYKLAILILGLFLLVITIINLPEIRSLESRFLLWKNALPLIKSNPIIGSGINTFEQIMQSNIPKTLYHYESMNTIPANPHNFILESLLERGLLGGILSIINIGILTWVFFYKKLLTKPIKIAFWSLTAYSLSSFFGFSTISHLPILLTLWAILIHNVFKIKNIQIKIYKPLKIFICFCMISFAIFSGQFALRTIYADYLFTKSISSFINNNNPEESFNKLIRVQPHYAKIPESALDLLSAFNLSKKNANQYLAGLKRITNNNYRYYFYAGKNAHYLQDYKLRDNYFNEAEKLAPNWPYLHKTWANLALKSNDIQIAKEKLEKLESLAPSCWDFPPPKNCQSAPLYQFRKSNKSFINSMQQLLQIYTQLEETEKQAKLKQKLNTSL